RPHRADRGRLDLYAPGQSAAARAPCAGGPRHRREGTPSLERALSPADRARQAAQPRRHRDRPRVARLHLGHRPRRRARRHPAALSQAQPTSRPATRRETPQPPSTPPDASAWKRAAGQGNPRPHPERRHADTRAQCEAPPRRIRSGRYPTHASEIEQPSQLLPLPGPCIGTEPAPRAENPARTIPRGPTLQKRTSEDEDVLYCIKSIESASVSIGDHPGRFQLRAKRTASSAAAKRARALSRISWCSAAGLLSATTPQPACTTISPSLTMAVRSTMQVSMLPSPAKYPTAPA